jgi:hypothetical protein
VEKFGGMPGNEIEHFVKIENENNEARKKNKQEDAFLHLCIQLSVVETRATVVAL